MRSKPQDSGQPRKMWASVTAGAAITATSGGMRVVRRQAGVYDFTFERPFAGSGSYAVMATTSISNNVYPVVQSKAGASFSVVTPLSTTGALTDSDFSVEVTAGVY